MDTLQWILIIATVLLSTVSQLLLKHGMNQVGAVEFLWPQILTTVQLIILNPFIILGTLGYALGLSIWLIVLSKVEVGVAFPLLSLSYVTAIFGGYLLFGEPLSLLRLTGAAIIILGVFLVAHS